MEINPDGDHVTRFDAAWLIVPADISDAVDARFADENRKKFVAKPGARAKYLLLGGMLLCPDCGGRFEALNGKYYVCATRRHAGKSVCANPLALRIDVLDEAVLGFLDRRILHPPAARPIELWSGRAEDLAVYEGADPDDRRGKENIEFSDLGFRAEVRPESLLAGFGALSLVAGACTRRYRRCPLTSPHSAEFPHDAETRHKCHSGWPEYFPDMPPDELKR